MENKSEFKSPVIKSADFITSAGKPSEYPPEDLPEIAFAGRSNVGKSTLVNCLVNRNKLVKTSKTPGRTQRINFFEVNKSVRFVDLPGYGYAKVSKQMRGQWEHMIETYLLSRKNLKALVWIIDIRREPAEFEYNFGLWLNQNNIPYINVLTKADKLSGTKQRNHKQNIVKTMGAEYKDFIIASGLKKTGRDEIWSRILNLTGATND
ncbi:MAG: ribosome biogenesis GTP-binding protein YihA/YsxC [Thermodesulfobacteriota bacterium]